MKKSFLHLHRKLFLGFIPDSEIWVKLGGDKGGNVLNTTKMDFQIINVPAQNAVYNTCVVSCFEAADTVINLHCALDRFKILSPAAPGNEMEVHCNCNIVYFTLDLNV